MMADLTVKEVESLAESARVEQVHDQIRWDAAIAELGGSLLQSWQWGEFKGRHGWVPHRFFVEQDRSIVAAAQVLSRPVGPFSVLYVPRGPAVRDVNHSGLSALSLAIDQLGSATRSAIAFIEPDDEDGFEMPWEGVLAWSPSQTELQPLRTIKVAVDRDDDEILAGMKNKCRYNVRLAGRRGVTVRHATIEEIVDFYEVLSETSERDEFGIHGIEYYADMLDVFRDSAALLIAEFDGAIAAGAIVLQHGNEAIYMFGASSRAHQRHMPSHLLQFEAMRWARERGCQWYDLWGIPPTDTPPEETNGSGLNVRSGLWGVYRFKQGFGGEIVHYPGVFERPYYPRLINLWRLFRPGPGA
jgi:peptidoglycan pentaglycine glycine transferase (the first glycine)